MFLVKCMPIVGTAVTAFEAIDALIDGNPGTFLAKTAQTCVSGVLDVAFVLSAGTSSLVTSPLKVGMIEGGKIVGKKTLEKLVVHEAGKITTNIAARAASEYVLSKVCQDINEGRRRGGHRRNTTPNSNRNQNESTSNNRNSSRQNEQNRNTNNQDNNQENNDENQSSEENNDDKSEENESTTEEEEESDESEQDSPFTKTIITNQETLKIIEGYDSHARHPLAKATLTKSLNTNIVSNTDKSPVIESSSRNNGVPEYLRAEIKPKHLNTGEATRVDPALAEIIRGYGDGGDQAGHGLGNQFGGLMREYNLFPQNPSINSGNWRAEYEKPMRSWLENGGTNANIQFQLRFIYQNAQDTRPIGFYYLIKFKVKNRIVKSNEVLEATGEYIEPILFGYVPNPPSNESYTVDGPEDYKVTKKKNKKKISN